MGHYIPSFYLPIDKSELPKTLENWRSAEDVLADYYETPVLRETCSRNWWHQYTLLHISKILNISGFEFLRAEIVCLDVKELGTVADALADILDHLSKGLPEFEPTVQQDGPFWDLFYYCEDGVEKEYSRKTLIKAFNEAQVVKDARCDTDAGYQAIVTFFSFIKSLHDSVEDAIKGQKSLLYVQPQP